MDPILLVKTQTRRTRSETDRRSGSVTGRPSRADRSPTISNVPFIFADSGAKIVTDDAGRVLWASPATAALTSDSSCITLANGELGGRTRYSNNVLKEIFCDLRAADYPVDQLLAASTEDRPELFVRAQSCSSQGVRMNSFTIRRLDRDMRETPDLRRLYGLTKTEQQIVGEMLRGRSVAEIAVELHKSVLTVRTHVKRIYTKLNVGTKEQLFSSVMKLMID